MKIIVLLKQTPDTEATIKLDSSNTRIDMPPDMKFIINPYDEFAIEEALKIKEKKTDAEVVILSFGRDDVKERILRGLAMGADRGLLVSSQDLEEADSLTIAKILTKVIKNEGAKLVLCGKQAIDDDNMHVGVMVAELLVWPHVNVVTKLTLEGESVVAEREVEGGQTEVYQVQLPAVFGAHKSLNTPRYASLPGIMKAKKKPLETKTVSEIGLDGNTLKKDIKTKIASFSFPPKKPAGKLFVDGSVEEKVAKVVKLLREEAKVI